MAEKVVIAHPVQFYFFWQWKQNLLQPKWFAPNHIQFASKLSEKSYTSKNWALHTQANETKFAHNTFGLNFFLWIDLRLYCTPNKEINLKIWCHTLFGNKQQKKGVVISCSVHSFFQVTCLGIKQFWFFPHIVCSVPKDEALTSLSNFFFLFLFRKKFFNYSWNLILY